MKALYQDDKLVAAETRNRAAIADAGDSVGAAQARFQAAGDNDQ
jgi:hypothetical protein